MQTIDKIKILNNMFGYLLWVINEDDTVEKKDLSKFVKYMNTLSLEIENEIKNT